MEINTKYHGVKEYLEEDIITFKRGLPGFEDLRKFILFSVEENESFSILQSIEDDSIGIVTIPPFGIFENYEVNLKDELLHELCIKQENDVMVLSTVTISSNINKITVNLKAPIIINIKERLGEQIILDKAEYSIKHPLIQE